MTVDMESNKWLWRPHKGGPIYIRFSYRDGEGKKRSFARALWTDKWPEARRIRDVELKPIILDINKARLQLEIIRKRFPELEKELEDALQGRAGRGDGRGAGTTLAELYDAWSKAISRKNSNFEVAERTARRYGAICRRFIDHLGADRLLAEVATADATEYRDSRLNTYGKTKKTVDLELIAIRSMFRYGIEKMGMVANPAKGVSVRRTKAERVREKRRGANRPPTHEEADTICGQFPGKHKRYTQADFQDYATFARYTGLRQGEIAQLRVGDFLLFDGELYADAVLRTPENFRRAYEGTVPEGEHLCIHVADTADRQTKTGLERIVPVAAKLRDTLDRRLREAVKGKLFPFAVKDGGASFGRTWLKRVKKIHPELTMHGFRHYATSEMENAGVNTTVAKAITGHRQASVHEGYVHVQVKTLRAAVETIY